MYRRILACAIVLGALASPAAAQTLLPPDFSGWTSVTAEQVRPETLERLAGDAAPVLREYGALSAERRTYTRHGEGVVLTLYRMRDPSGAYGAYTFLREADMTEGLLGQDSAMSPKRALVLVGNLLLDISGGNLTGAVPHIRGAVATLFPKAQTGPLPTLSQFLPRKGLQPHSERYVLGPEALNRVLPLGNGDWIGFADGAEVQLARYRIRGQDLTLLLASYPTPQLAARKLEELDRWLVKPSQAARGDHPRVLAKRSASLMALVTAASSEEAARALLDGIRYESDITWNEPNFSATDPTIGEIIVGIFYGTSFIMLFAVFAGIGFGGVRLLVKYLVPGKVFDRSASVEILQLGLTSKPIEAKDFYENPIP